MSKGDGAESIHQFSNGIKVGCFVRNRAEDISDVNTYYIRKNHIVGNQCDEFIDLESTILSSALEVTKERKKDAGKVWDKTYPAPDIVRQEFRSKQNPLLIIYPLNPKCSNVLDKTGNIIKGTVQYSASDEPFIGLAISFPGSETNHAISYVVNQVGDFVETEDMFDENNDNVLFSSNTIKLKGLVVSLEYFTINELNNFNLVKIEAIINENDDAYCYNLFLSSGFRIFNMLVY